ncbi:copper resistance protein B [Novosphingobium sp. JCM 18896]
MRREFAPYLGVSWQRKFGETADLARQNGGSTGGVNFVAGIRAWF